MKSVKFVETILLIVFSALILIACSGGGGGGGTSSTGGGGGTTLAGKADCTAEAGSGVVCGKVVAADGVTPLAGAEVRINNPSKMIISKGVPDPNKCVADSSGDFACIVPSSSTGDITFVIISSGFDNKTFTATITKGATADSGKQTMAGSASEKWVVIPGTFDGVQVLLSQLKGCVLSDGAGNPFDPATMQASTASASTDCTNKGLLVLDGYDPTSETYVATFLTGNKLNTYDALFVNCGGNYSSETGVNEAMKAFSDAGKHIYFSDLASYGLTEVFPGVITFAGNETNTGTISSNVPYANLAAVVGSPIDIIFDLSVWTAIDTVGSNVTTFIEGDLSSITGYTGTHPITVGWRPASNSGCVFYTSYHIEGASTGAKQELAIKYLVQNIATVCR